MNEIIKKYSNNEVTVIWQPAKCIHSKKCFHGLPQVFDPGKRPWVNIEGDTTSHIIDQVKACPSGALSFQQKNHDEVTQSAVRIEVLPDGPLLVKGGATLIGVDGQDKQCEGTAALCRCGASANKPFCDGSHVRAGFKDP